MCSNFQGLEWETKLQWEAVISKHWHKYMASALKKLTSSRCWESPEDRQWAACISYKNVECFS